MLLVVPSLEELVALLLPAKLQKGDVFCALLTVTKDSRIAIDGKIFLI
jgi:hypothetical protein